MHRAPLLLLALAALAAAARASEDPTAAMAGVTDLTPDNWDAFAGQLSTLSMVEFYAPWCGHCKHLAPEYAGLAAAVAADAGLRGRVRIAKVDADAHRSLGEKFDVSGFPTIVTFGRGKALTAANAERYEGPRTTDGMLAFIRDALASDTGFARVEAMDPLAAEFVAADAAGAAAVIERAAATAAGLEEADRANGDMYVSLMRKAQEKGGAAWLVTEASRLERVIGSGALSATKLGEISRKASVLSAFAPAAKDEL
jgi:protein disulfide-isomerase A6